MIIILFIARWDGQFSEPMKRCIDELYKVFEEPAMFLPDFSFIFNIMHIIINKLSKHVGVEDVVAGLVLDN